jgi:hypothetical protein
MRDMVMLLLAFVATTLALCCFALPPILLRVRKYPSKASTVGRAWLMGLAIFASVGFATACTAKQVQDAKNIGRRVNDIARELCEATMGADAEKQGFSVRELCLLPHVLGPFLQAPRLAAVNAKAGAAVAAPDGCSSGVP